MPSARVSPGAAGEQLALEWGDIDFRNGFVAIRRSSADGVVTATKSGRERRVPLTAGLRKALKAHKHLRGPLVFCNGDGSPMNRYQLHERLWTACRRSGLRKIRWHDLRHSFATQLVARGVPLRQVQGWLGHSTAQMTERYAHLQPHSGAELIGVLDEPVSRGRGNDVANGLLGTRQTEEKSPGTFADSEADDGVPTGNTHIREPRNR